MGDDTIYGADGQNDIAYLSEGNDVIDLGTSASGMGYFDWVSGAMLTEGFSLDLDSGLASWGAGHTSTLTGVEYAEGSAFDDTISGRSDFDLIQAGAGNDSVTGGTGGNDTLDGQAGDDTIEGGSGQDSLTGGAGDDSLTGGADDDVFVYSVGDGADTITDFNFGNSGALGDGITTNNDFIDLSAFYDNMGEVRADFEDDGVLNQSNTTAIGGEPVDYSDNAQFGAGDSLTFQGASAASFTADNTGILCFAAGTMILTPSGERPVESLAPGDLVTTRDNGPQRLIWCARQILSGKALEKHPALRPILIRPGAFGMARALTVSPQHALLLCHEGEQHLVRANHLARMPGGAVRVKNGCRGIVYVHVMCARHEILFADGYPTESFFPGPRAIRALDPAARRQLLSLSDDLSAIARGGPPPWRPALQPVARPS